MRGISLFIAGAILLARALPVAVAFLSATSSIGLPRASPLSCASFLGSTRPASSCRVARSAHSQVAWMSAGESPAARLRAKLATKQILTMPCCFDALSARLIERAGFEITFMSGFSTSAAKLGLPDTGYYTGLRQFTHNIPGSLRPGAAFRYISYGEMIDAGRDICAAVSIPVLGDGDTGYGNAMNVKRTVRGYAQAGFAAVMIEDQVAPKRCGHTKGKEVVGREEALGRVRAAVDARNEGADILILARTDAREKLGLEEALERIRLFAEVGADIVFMEAPQSVEEMRAACKAAPNTPHLANMLEGGKTPILPPAELKELGFGIAAYPLTLLSAAVSAMNSALQDLKAGRDASNILDFAELRDVVGFNDYYAEEERYKQQ